MDSPVLLAQGISGLTAAPDSSVSTYMSQQTDFKWDLLPVYMISNRTGTLHCYYIYVIYMQRVFTLHTVSTYYIRGCYGALEKTHRTGCSGTKCTLPYNIHI